MRSFLVVALLMTSSAALRSQAPVVAAHEVKAAYLYQFGKYVEWPSDPRTGAPFAICILGQDPFGLALDDIVKGRLLSDRPVTIKRIIGASELQDCRILFISRSEDDRLLAILKELSGRTVLTVGEGLQFTRRGGMVGFTTDSQKIRFAVNLAAAEAAQLRVSSQLLRVAVSVHRGQQ